MNVMIKFLSSLSTLVFLSSCYSPVNVDTTRPHKIETPMQWHFSPSFKTMSFSANFEDSSLQSWDYLLHPQGIEISNDHSFKGNFAAKITVKGTPDYLWHGHDSLNRSEMQYKPKSTKEGSRTRLKFAFMLPELFNSNRHEFAYWESDQSYQQIMRFEFMHDSLLFVPVNTSKIQSVLVTQSLNPNEWYELAMDIEWSTDAAKGKVSVWLDNQLIIDKMPIATLIGEQSNFVQLGILRDRQEKAETIWIDEVMVWSL